LGGRESIEVFVREFLAALDRLEERKQPLTRAPLNELRERVENPATSSLPASLIVRKLVEAGYNVEDIREFFLDAGIIRDMDEWVQMKVDVERAIIMAKLEEMMGGALREQPVQVQSGGE